jgi:nucleotide-binding universal stress UspA family protein
LELRHLLVHLDSTERTRLRLELAVALAKRSGAVLTAVFAESAQLGPSVVAMRNPVRMETALAEVRAAFEAKVCSARLPNEWWQVGRGDYAYVVGSTVACCRYSDLAIFGQYDPAEPRVPADLVEQVLLGSGRPVLVVPSRWSRSDVATRVLVAWTGSREAARAVNDAIPLMEGAEEVTVLALQHGGESEAAVPPPLDIVAHLNAHGIAAAYEPVKRNGTSAVGTLLNRAAEIHADLIVMGGKGSFPLLQQSRTTREILRSMACPVLLAS